MGEKGDYLVLDTEKEELVLTRTFYAPRYLVFKAWTEPYRMAKWWGPKGYTILSNKMDLRPGGIFLYRMMDPDGFEMWGKFVYHEISTPKRIAFVNSFSDENEDTIRHPLHSTWPLEIKYTLIFSEFEGRTILTLRGYPLNASDEERKTFEAGHQSIQEGFQGTLDQLNEYLVQTLKGERV